MKRTDEECRPKELRCKNGRCARICDGHAQCPDKADEQGCGKKFLVFVISLVYSAF